MFRQSPRRNERARGMKVKHVVQIIFVLGASSLLLYQVQDSQNYTPKVLEKFGYGNEDVKLGRKDLQSRVDAVKQRDEPQTEDSELDQLQFAEKADKEEEIEKLLGLEEDRSGQDEVKQDMDDEEKQEILFAGSFPDSDSEELDASSASSPSPSQSFEANGETRRAGLLEVGRNSNSGLSPASSPSSQNKDGDFGQLISTMDFDVASPAQSPAYGYIEGALKRFLGEFTDEIEPVVKTSDISAPSESKTDTDAYLIDDIGEDDEDEDQAGSTEFSQEDNEVDHAHLLGISEAPTGAMSPSI